MRSDRLKYEQALLRDPFSGICSQIQRTSASRRSRLPQVHPQMLILWLRGVARESAFLASTPGESRLSRTLLWRMLRAELDPDCPRSDRSPSSKQ